MLRDDLQQLTVNPDGLRTEKPLATADGDTSVSAHDNVTRIGPQVAARAGEAYFERNEGFVPERVALEIARDDIIAYGHDDRLWRYSRGVFLPDGDHHARVRTRELLGERFRRQHGDQVVAWFRAHEATIGVKEPSHLVNCANGVLNWQTGVLHPHDPTLHSTVQIPVSWNPAAQCPRIEQFLGEVLPDAATVALVYEIAGYCLLTELVIHVVVLLLGPGRNGKSTVLRVLRAFLGDRNVSAVTVQALVENRFACAQLHGKLANLAGDLDARAIRRSDTLKMLTGGDPIMAERKHGQPFEFVSFATPIFSANEAPISSDQSEAWFSRWLTIPMTRMIGADSADPHLARKLTTDDELEGLFVRAVAGLRALMQRGRFDLPEPVHQAGDRYRDRLDTARAFVDEQCVVHPDTWIGRPALYRAYKDWARDGGRYALANVTFYEHLTRNLDGHLEERTRRGTRGLAGIGLRTESAAP